MEVHTPKKPVRHWRELLSEVGIIVLGVLIALGAEQIAEAVHWHFMVADARASIRSELAANALNATGWRIRGQCFNRQLDAITTRLAAIKDGEPTPLLKSRFVTTFLPWPTGAWSSAEAAQVMVHMPQSESEQYALIYSEINQISAAQTSTFGGQATLWTLMSASRPLSPELRQQVLQAIAQERAYIFYQATYARDVVNFAAQAGIQPDPKDFARHRAGIMACPTLL